MVEEVYHNNRNQAVVVESLHHLVQLLNLLQLLHQDLDILVVPHLVLTTKIRNHFRCQHRLVKVKGMEDMGIHKVTRQVDRTDNSHPLVHQLGHLEVLLGLVLQRARLV